MKKICIFCARRADSDEDVIPKWIPRLLRKQERERVPMRTTRFGHEPHDQLAGESIQKVGSVCSQCNNGWMSRLEEDVKPILKPMMLGNAVTLTAKQQERIATWMTKLAMMYESMATGEVFYNGLDRQHFWKTGSPLDSTAVWLGQYTGGIRIIVDYRLLSRRQNPGGSIRILVLTLVLGKLALQLTTARGTHLIPKIELPTMVLENTQDLLIQVWPWNLLGIKWPPLYGFDDETTRIKYLVVRFGGKELASGPNESGVPRPAP
ncbi:MAG: hypothetical protein U0236_11005 [Nitrospira sp.]